MTQHKWHKEIKAWADGIEVECRNLNAEWVWGVNDDGIALFDNENYVFRVKPQPKEPIKLFVIQHLIDKSIRLSADGFYTPKLEKMIGKIELLEKPE